MNVNGIHKPNYRLEKLNLRIRTRREQQSVASVGHGRVGVWRWIESAASDYVGTRAVDACDAGTVDADCAFALTGTDDAEGDPD
jgi:hypothetical protein